MIYMRKPRIKQTGACYHITARSNRGEFILHSTKIKDMFLSVLLRAKKKYEFRLKHFCIMSNHIHLMIEPQEKTDLSRIMQWILSVFAIRFNKIYGHNGHVWYDRFKSSVIRTLHRYIKIFEYISNNPLKAKMCKTVFEYEYSGLAWFCRNNYELVEPPDGRLGTEEE